MVTLLWLSMGLGMAAEPLEGVWNLLSFRANDGTVTQMAETLTGMAAECEVFSISLQLDADAAWVVAETVCPVPERPDASEPKVLARCIAAANLNLTREGLTLSSHTPAKFKAELHRVRVVTDQQGGSVLTNRSSKSLSCSASAQPSAFQGALAPQEDGTLQLQTANGTIVFERGAVRTHPL
jgi:hypothetical protein